MRFAVCIYVIAVYNFIPLSASRSCRNNLVPLYRLYNEKSDDYIYTTSLDEVSNDTKNLSYFQDGSPGLVSKTASDCACGNQFKPVYRLYREGMKLDHHYTQSESEVAICTERLDYINKGIAFYCPSSGVLAECGASIPLLRYWRGFNHFFTTDVIEGNEKVVARGGNYEEVVCDIWPVTAPHCRTPLDNLVPLYRLNRQNSHFYATNENANIAVSFHGYERGGSPIGQVATSSKDCQCGNNLQPVHKLMKFKGARYYCATTFGECDASIPLYRYWFRTRHFYTTNIDEGNKTAVSTGGIYEGIYCYIWESK